MYYCEIEYSPACTKWVSIKLNNDILKSVKLFKGIANVIHEYQVILIETHLWALHLTNFRTFSPFVCESRLSSFKRLQLKYFYP